MCSNYFRNVVISLRTHNNNNKQLSCCSFSRVSLHRIEHRTNRSQWKLCTWFLNTPSPFKCRNPSSVFPSLFRHVSLAVALHQTQPMCYNTFWFFFDDLNKICLTYSSWLLIKEKKIRRKTNRKCHVNYIWCVAGVFQRIKIIPIIHEPMNNISIHTSSTALLIWPLLCFHLLQMKQITLNLIFPYPNGFFFLLRWREIASFPLILFIHHNKFKAVSQLQILWSSVILAHVRMLSECEKALRKKR